MYIYKYIYIYTNIYIYIYIYIFFCTCIYVHVCAVFVLRKLFCGRELGIDSGEGASDSRDTELGIRV